GRSRRKHLPLAGSLEVAVELFVEKQAAKRPASAVILRLLCHFYFERSSSGHGRLFLVRMTSPFIGLSADCQAGKGQSEKYHEFFHGFLQSCKIIANSSPLVL